MAIKLFSFVLLIMALLTGACVFAEAIVFDDNNFVRCYSNADQSYFFDWDHYIKTSTKAVYYLKVKNCKQAKFLKDIPQEDLHPVSEIRPLLPEQITFLIDQVENGAHVPRIEKTAAEYIKNRPAIFALDSPEVLTKLRYEVGDSFATEVIRFWSASEIVKNKSCDSLIGSCDFYLCQEQKNPCGLDGYSLSYGYKYCSGSKFKLLNQMETNLGKAWVDEVFQCLQAKSFQSSQKLSGATDTCHQIKMAAFDSHPDCYVKAGFCSLESSEKRKIFNLIKGEIFSVQTLKQGLDLLKQCAAKN